ncbi:MAG: radical SAM protein [Bacteroidales bacterium]|nr:radical SAM protein [Candidatus Colimorpha merdihippi]
MLDLQQYMASAITQIVTTAYKNVIGNPRQALFFAQMQVAFGKAERRRKAIADSESLSVPPFLIASIATACNLRCKGCYAVQNGLVKGGKGLTAQQWRAIFDEASSLGISFALLAGGEPLTRQDILEQAAEVSNMIFPVFTNGTLINDDTVKFFSKNLNIIPFISIEGDQHQTDERRGDGIHKIVEHAMEVMEREKVFFGASITVTAENWQTATSVEYLKQLSAKGCRAVIFVEYVPAQEGTDHLVLDDEQLRQLGAAVEERREQCQMILLSFPGDEEAVGGCLAAGCGFFHINPTGKAEPCPFSPYSDTSVLEVGVKGALNSPLFRKLQMANLVGGEQHGGCTLFDHREEVEAIVKGEE